MQQECFFTPNHKYGITENFTDLAASGFLKGAKKARNKKEKKNSED